MAAVFVTPRSSDRTQRRRPFSSWVKRFTNLKSSESQKAPNTVQPKGKKSGTSKNNPYPESGYDRPAAAASETTHDAYSVISSQVPHTASSSSIPLSANTQGAATSGNKSVAPTVATQEGTIHSDAGHSKAATGTTNGGGLSYVDGAGGNSTFTSPNQSTRSLATTLTTIQSTSPANALNQQSSAHPHSGSTHHGPTAIQFSHQYPVSPASAIPPHLAATGSGHPATYATATANNLLSDDASVLTLASSSKRQRRRSMDTDASVRALAPSSLWGGSRESLPLSVLSSNHEPSISANLLGTQPARAPATANVMSAERASVYSSQGVSAPALASERNSLYAPSHKQIRDQKDRERDRDARSIDGRSMHKDLTDARSLNNTDARSLYGGDSLRGVGNYEGGGSSVRSGRLGHGRNDSNPGSVVGSFVTGTAVSKSGFAPTSSRRSSDWAAQGHKDDEEQDEEDEEERRAESDEEKARDHA